VHKRSVVGVALVRRILSCCVLVDVGFVSPVVKVAKIYGPGKTGPIVSPPPRDKSSVYCSLQINQGRRNKNKAVNAF
jgi:hypothetical protein